MRTSFLPFLKVRQTSYTMIKQLYIIFYKFQKVGKPLLFQISRPFTVPCKQWPCGATSMMIFDDLQLPRGGEPM